MKPTPGVALRELAISDVPVLAKELTAGGTLDLGASARYAIQHGAHGAVVDLGDVDGDASVLARLDLKAPISA